MARSTSLIDEFQRTQFKEWLNEEVTKSRRSKSEIARAFSHDSNAHVNKILSGEVMPAPQTLRKLCEAIGISWAGAFAIAGYFGELLEALADLALLGESWAKEDGAYTESFRSIGIVRFDKRNATEALRNDELLNNRYTIAKWREIEMETVISPNDSDGNPLSAEEFERLQALSRMSRNTYIVIVPKPTAAALLVATTGFPRRGDVYKNDASVFAANLLIELSAMISEAQSNAKYRRKLHPMLESARTVLADRSIPFDARRPVAAEYVVAWADMVCQPFTHYGRLAAYDYFGEVGSSLSTITPYVRLPQLRLARLPELSTIFA